MPLYLGRQEEHSACINMSVALKVYHVFTF